MFEVNVKNVTEKGRRRRGGGEGDQLGFGVLIQHSTVQYNTEKYSKAQYSTVLQCITVQYLYQSSSVMSPHTASND